MKFKLLYSPEALKDLEDIRNYIEYELLELEIAIDIIDRIFDKVQSLEQFPDMGAMLSSVAECDTDHRFLISGSYMIFYRHDDKNVYIDRVLYGKRDYIRVLFDNLDE